MDLGNTFILAFFILALVATGLSLLVGVLLARLSHRRAVGVVTFVVTLVFLGWPCSHYHQRMFTYLHQRRNDLVPRRYPCLEYRPTVSTLHAKYAMSSTEFQQWIAQHAWPLELQNDVRLHDQEWMGMENVELGYATPSAPNGRQLRAYHARGMAYISYNAF